MKFRTAGISKLPQRSSKLSNKGIGDQGQYETSQGFQKLEDTEQYLPNSELLTNLEFYTEPNHLSSMNVKNDICKHVRTPNACLPCTLPSEALRGCPSRERSTLRTQKTQDLGN